MNRNILDLPQHDPRCALGWRASYEVWSLRTSQISFRLFLDIDPEKVQKLISLGHVGFMEDEVPRLKELEFCFPVAFGPSFRSVLILGYLVHIQELEGSEFSNDPTTKCQFSIVDLVTNDGRSSPPLEGYVLAQHAHSSTSSLSTGDAAIVSTQGFSKAVGSHIATAQRANELTIRTNKDGLQEASMLQQSSDSVVLSTAVEDGTARQALLSKLPRHLHSNKPVLLREDLDQQVQNEITRLTWIKPPQAWYSFEEIVNEEIPVMLERHRSTIPEISVVTQPQITGQSSDTKRKITSLDEIRNPKERK